MTQIGNLLMVMNVVILALWPLLSIAALFRLRSVEMSDVARVGWAAVILVIPVLGAIAFFLVGKPANGKALS